MKSIATKFEQILYINGQRFRGGLLFNAHRPWCHSTLGLKERKKNKKLDERCTLATVRSGDSNGRSDVQPDPISLSRRQDRYSRSSHTFFFPLSLSLSLAHTHTHTHTHARRSMAFRTWATCCVCICQEAASGLFLKPCLRGSEGNWSRYARLKR